LTGLVGRVSCRAGDVLLDFLELKANKRKKLSDIMRVIVMILCFLNLFAKSGECCQF
jgi:hypothetical protein